MDFNPISGRDIPRFAGIKTFFRLPYIANKKLHQPPSGSYDVALVGVPFDGGVSYRPGARFAPMHVRQASSLGRGYSWSRAELLWEKNNFADIGDCPVVPIDLAQTYKKVEKYFSQLLEQNKKFLAIGGDHSTTLPLLRAASKKHGPLSLIHFDAHLDTYPAAWGCEYHHGTFVRHAVDEGLVDAKKSIQIGLRGPLAGGDDLDFVKKHGLRATTVDDLRIGGLEKFLSKLPEFKGPTYISFDVDCLDPAYAPGTGTPVPGGLTTYETQRILRALKIKNLIGADIVEVCPAYDHADVTALAAVDTMFEIMHLF